MKITVDGTEYEFDQERLTIREAMAIQTVTGMNLMAWQRGLEEFDAYAVAALVYLLKLRAGESVKFDEIDFNLADLKFEGIEPPAEAPGNDDAEDEAA